MNSRYQAHKVARIYVPKPQITDGAKCMSSVTPAMAIRSIPMARYLVLSVDRKGLQLGSVPLLRSPCFLLFCSRRSGLTGARRHAPLISEVAEPSMLPYVGWAGGIGMPRISFVRGNGSHS